MLPGLKRGIAALNRMDTIKKALPTVIVCLIVLAVVSRVAILRRTVTGAAA
jgi:hypothetical protein